MVIQRYLVSAPGRVGSHLVVACIRSAGWPVLHTHNPFLPTDNDNVTALVLVQRRDLFAAVMSQCITWRTGQSTAYTNTAPAPFAVRKDMFEDLYYRQKYYAASHDLSRAWAKIETVYFEDFIDNYDCIFEKLELKQRPELLSTDVVQRTWTQQAPYNYKHVATNHQECRTWFDQLEQAGRVNLWTPRMVRVGSKETQEHWE